MDENEIMNNTADDSVENISEKTEETAVRQEAPKPVYDPFMYEPIGFDGYDKERVEELKKMQELDEKKSRKRQDSMIMAFFMTICAASVLLAGYAVVSDVMRGSEFIEDLVPPQSIVMYEEAKPKDANKLENFVDENGKYTTEGVSAAVKSSIVEIYTFENKMSKEASATGSGIILSKDGYIVTNAHVLDAEGFHRVVIDDNKDNSYEARIIGRDVKTDIAVIKIEGKDFKPAVLGNSDEVIVGEQVVAVGNPAGFSNSVTSGIISAVNRNIKSDSTGFKMDCLQTDAAISPGNSGGALVNMYGQVIGITSSKYVSVTTLGLDEGLGFAISINEVKKIVEELVEKGYIGGRFRIGITLIDMSGKSKISAIQDELGFELPENFEGIYISSISEDCDIYNTELKAGDFITAINGNSVKTYDEFYDEISRNYKAGDKVPATCAHIDKNKKVTYYNIEFKLMEDTSGNY